MRIVILSDIHGNLEALRSITDSWDELWVLDYPMTARSTQRSLTRANNLRSAGRAVVAPEYLSYRSVRGAPASQRTAAIARRARTARTDLARGKVVAGRNRLSGIDDTADKPTAGQEEVR